MDSDTWKCELESKLARYLFENPEKPYITFKNSFRLNDTLRAHFVKSGFRPERVEEAFREFYETAFEDGDPMEFDLSEKGIDVVISWVEHKHPSGLLGLLTAEGWMRAYIGCISTGRLQEADAWRK